jgi:hypothetical protein
MIKTDEGRLYELQCKCRALADLFAGTAWLEENGMHEDTPYGLHLIMRDSAGEIEAAQEGGGT